VVRQAKKEINEDLFKIKNDAIAHQVEIKDERRFSNTD
jgi:hypothetical protein